MSNFSFSQSQSLHGSGFKKRKRDPIQIDGPNITTNNSNARIIPSSNNPDHPFLFSCPDAPKDNEALAPRIQYLPRKRRLFSQPFFHPQHVQPFPLPIHSNSTQTRLLPPSICVPASQNLTSPPVSPKSLIPYTSHQNPTYIRSCHICHRRPTTRELLDAYADCNLCYRRTCYICLRECDSPDCSSPDNDVLEPSWEDTLNSLEDEPNGIELQARQPRKICSRCAVEGITETGVEVVQCLDCVRKNYSKWPPPKF